MKKLIILKQSTVVALLLFVISQTGCHKEDDILDDVSPSVSNSTQDRFNPGSYDSHVIQSWYALELKLISETPGHSPPVAGRELGYTGIALYESLLVGGTVNNHSLSGQLTGLNNIPQRENGKQYAAPLVANAALSRIITNLFGNASAANVATIDSLATALELQYGASFSNDVIIRSRDFGYTVADAIFNWSMSDGGHEAYLNPFPPYSAPVGNDKWVPTPPMFQPALLPYWGDNRTFVPSNGPGPVDPPPPPAFSTVAGSTFYNEAALVFNTVKNLSPTQQTIASYWADGGGTFSPAGHNIAIALQAIRNSNMNLSQAAKLLARVGIGLNDAGIVCWRAKFNADLLRPVTYINNFIDAGWGSFVTTPPFPSYTSGHSTFSSVSASLLTTSFGNNYAFTDSSKIANGFAPRSYSSFAAAAQEAAYSRLLGGIHYQFDNDNGYACGQDIAANVLALNW